MAFATVPIISAVAYVPPLFSGSSVLYERFLCLVSLTSLIVTGYVMKNSSRSDKNATPRSTNLERLLTASAISCTLLVLAFCLVKMVDAPQRVRPALYFIPGGIYIHYPQGLLPMLTEYQQLMFWHVYSLDTLCFLLNPCRLKG